MKRTHRPTQLLSRTTHLSSPRTAAAAHAGTTRRPTWPCRDTRRSTHGLHAGDAATTDGSRQGSPGSDLEPTKVEDG